MAGIKRVGDKMIIQHIDAMTPKVEINLGHLDGSAGLSIRLLTLARVMISWFMSSSPTSGSVLAVQSLLGILSPSLSVLPLLALSLSLSKIKLKKKKKFEK